MMTKAFAHLGIDAAYVACDVNPVHLRAAVRGLAALGAVGANVTVPHKVNAAACCDTLDPLAEAIGAVNTLRVEAGHVVGYNTDALGAVDALRAAKVDPVGKRAVVLGSGGAARAVAAGLATTGAAHVAVRARSLEAARAVLDGVMRLGGRGDAGVLARGDDAIARADLIVQATSAGLEGAPDDAQVIAALDLARAGAVAMDVVYAPRETRWLRAARTHGLHTVDGLGMLAGQAARALTLWFEMAVPLDILRGFLDAPGTPG
jgi:shikimate dehydrogenase